MQSEQKQKRLLTLFLQLQCVKWQNLWEIVFKHTQWYFPQQLLQDQCLLSSGHISHLRVNVCDHFAARLVSLSVIGSFLFVLKNSFTCGSVLQSELTDDPAEAIDADVTNTVRRLTQEQQKWVKPGDRQTFSADLLWHTAVDETHRWKSGVKWWLSLHLFMIRLWTVFRMMILSAQSFTKSDIFCFRAGFISCFAITFRWSHDALQRHSIWVKFSCSWSKSTWRRWSQNSLVSIAVRFSVCSVKNPL